MATSHHHCQLELLLPLHSHYYCYFKSVRIASLGGTSTLNCTLVSSVRIASLRVSSDNPSGPARAAHVRGEIQMKCSITTRAVKEKLNLPSLTAWKQGLWPHNAKRYVRDTSGGLPLCSYSAARSYVCALGAVLYHQAVKKNPTLWEHSYIIIVSCKYAPPLAILG